MGTVYVIEPGARVEKEYRHLLVVREDETLLRVPLADVSQVVLVGQGAGVTTPALHALLAENIPLSLVRRNGELLGRLVGPSGRNLELRRRQYRTAADEGFCVALSRQIVLGKLRNYHALALRWTRGCAIATSSDPDTGDERRGPALDRLRAALEQAETATDLASLRGIEGQGSKAYFAVLRGRLAGRMRFEKRTRRPPKDPANALLSLAYTLLGEAAATALEIVGLDPYEGFYHADKYGRPALALDLLEEFRGPVADSVVLTLINKRMLSEADFEGKRAAGSTEEGSGGVYLSRRGLATFLEAFTGRLQSRFTHPLSGRPLTYQKCLEVQARLLARTITGDAAQYRPLRVR